MLSEEWLRVIQDDREREFKAAMRVHAARGAERHDGRLRTWLNGRLSPAPAELTAPRQTGRTATDPTA